MPGSHIQPNRRDSEEGGVFCDGPAGTIGIHHQSIMHRRGKSTAKGLRRMLKYNYWRTAPPQRDWIVEEDFDFQSAYYGGHGTARYYAHIFYWLCGKGDQFRHHRRPKLGLGSPQTRSGHRKALTPRKATSPIGGGTIPMGMRVNWLARCIKTKHEC